MNAPFNVALSYENNNVQRIKNISLSLGNLKTTLLKIKKENKSIDRKWATPLAPLVKEHIMDKMVDEKLINDIILITVVARNSFFTALSP